MAVSVAKRLCNLMSDACYRIQRAAVSDGLAFGRDVCLRGAPVVGTAKDARIELGDEVMLNSKDRGYHVSMHSPVKLLADLAGAKIWIDSGTRTHVSHLHAWASSTVGERCPMTANCQIMDSSGHSAAFDDVYVRIHTTGSARPVEIGDVVWIGARSTNLLEPRIGRGSVVGAASVASGELPPMVVAGNPAGIVKPVHN